MQASSGLLIVLEGTDGSGKTTQFKLLHERLTAMGYPVATFDYPQYGEPSSFFVTEYLNGKYGTADEVGPYTASLFYALDRYQTAPQIREALAAGKIVLCNRYTPSNMAHQGAKFTNVEQRRGYFIWLDNIEYQTLGIPRPTISLVLKVPADLAQKLVDKKAARSYTTKKRDIHEADLGHLTRAVETYENMCMLFPKDFTMIDCTKHDTIRSIPDISNLIWERIKPMLPPKPQKSANASAEYKKVKLDTPNYLFKDDTGNWQVTDEGRAFLKEVVTNPTGNVYAFTDSLSTTTIAAAMARLSRRGDDMRVTLLDEFTAAQGKDSDLLQRVITAYGDDSVQQLAGQHVVIENASNLLTKKLEWGRLASYLEQSTRYIYFDKKNAKGQYRYFTPPNLDAATAKYYRQSMDELFDNYSKLVQRLTEYVRDQSSEPKASRDGAWKAATRAQACDAARPVLPVANTSTVGIYASGQALESLIMHLLADETIEARNTGEQLLTECRKVFGVFLERADKPERGGALIAYKVNTRTAMQDLALSSLPGNLAAETTAVQLNDYWPRNELDLVADMLYEYSNESLANIRETVGNWSYDQKVTALNTYVGERLNRRHRPGRALEKAHYSWDLICDYGIFRDLQRHRMVDDLAWQTLTPRYGYEIPELVESAGLSDIYEHCFDISLELYSRLQAEGYALEAQYATLLGHKMRWKITYNAREAFHFHELRTSPQGHPGYRKLVLQMHEKLAEVHPLLAEHMIFVNKDEDPELTRLAAERYTQLKLKTLNPKK